ncbi:arylesterase [Winogradskyella aurantia]|uniref:Arylesterase n=1 Tax=Winogradskyella aurantia TaxID=1915063 RepID=A0A265UT24_9FLAO|nr:arylesterase [Winogradskyella aurantia]OZV68463.1 arylesterase [Winogradskyella aurantia]
MFPAENTHLDLKPLTPFAAKILKFCYFIIILFSCSCGDDNSSKQTVNKEKTVTTTAKASDSTTTKTMLCFGDSITAGYGLNDANDAYPAILQAKMDSLDLDYTVINLGLSGETSAGGKSRINWVLNQDADIFLLELGANDGLRGVPLSETRSNLQAIIDAVATKNPKTKIILAGMELPPNMGQEYTTEFRKIFAELAQKNDVTFIPFILKNVGGISELNQADGIHPTAEGHKRIAHTVWEVLEPMVSPLNK